MTAALIAKLESASEGSRELDEQVFDALCDSKFRTRIAGLSDEQGGMWMYEFEGHAPSSALGVTTFVDAALALAERVLDVRGPININICLAGSAQVVINSSDACGLPLSQVVASTPALAICAALLRASAAEGARHE